MNSKFSDFLKHSVSQKEVSLAIAKDDQELNHFEKSLHQAGFKKAYDVSEILNDMKENSKVYYFIDEKLPKALYDLIIQYPTGQVETFDVRTMKSSVVAPTYDKSAIILLVEKHTLAYFQNKGYSILQHAGIAYQS